MENPRHGREVYLLRPPERIVVLPVTKMKKTAITQAITASDKQPARDELPCGQSEQIEADLLAEDRIHSATGRACRVPIKRERRPLHHVAGPRHDGDEEGDHETEEVQDARNW